MRKAAHAIRASLLASATTIALRWTPRSIIPINQRPNGEACCQDHGANELRAYAKDKKLPNADKVVTNDPMEATYVGMHMWKQAVEKAKTTDVDKVIEAMGGQKFKAPCGFELTMDKTNHHLHKPVMIGEIRGDGQFNVVYKTKGPIRAQPWSPFIAGNESKQKI